MPVARVTHSHSRDRQATHQPSEALPRPLLGGPGIVGQGETWNIQTNQAPIRGAEVPCLMDAPYRRGRACSL